MCVEVDSSFLQLISDPKPNGDSVRAGWSWIGGAGGVQRHHHQRQRNRASDPWKNPRQQRHARFLLSGSLHLPRQTHRWTHRSLHGRRHRRKFVFPIRSILFSSAQFLIVLIPNFFVFCFWTDFSLGRIPFAFLEDIHQKFVRTYGRAVHSAQPYGMNEEFSRVLSQQMEYYSSDPNADRINRLKGEMSQVSYRFYVVIENWELIAPVSVWLNNPNNDN